MHSCRQEWTGMHSCRHECIPVDRKVFLSCCRQECTRIPADRIPVDSMWWVWWVSNILSTGMHSCRQEGKKIAGGRNAPAILPNQKMYTWACRGAPPAPWARLRDSSAHNTSPCMPSETHVKGDVAETETRRGLEKSLIQLKESYAEQERLRAKESEQQVDVKMILCSMASANTLDLDRHEHKLNVSYRNRT